MNTVEILLSILKRLEDEGEPYWVNDLSFDSNDFELSKAMISSAAEHLSRLLDISKNTTVFISILKTLKTEPTIEDAEREALKAAEPEDLLTAANALTEAADKLKEYANNL